MVIASAVVAGNRERGGGRGGFVEVEGDPTPFLIRGERISIVGACGGGRDGIKG